MTLTHPSTPPQATSDHVLPDPEAPDAVPEPSRLDPCDELLDALNDTDDARLSSVLGFC